MLEPYQATLETDGATLAREGEVWCANRPIPVTVVKKFSFGQTSDRVGVKYEISSTDGSEVEVIFALENNFNFQAGHAPDRFVEVDGKRPKKSYLDSLGQHRSASRVALVDDYRSLAVGLTADRLFELWHMPIYTVSLSESGFEKVYQGTTLVQLFRLNLTEIPTVIELDLYAGLAVDRPSNR